MSEYLKIREEIRELKRELHSSDLVERIWNISSDLIPAIRKLEQMILYSLNDNSVFREEIGKSIESIINQQKRKKKYSMSWIFGQMISGMISGVIIGFLILISIYYLKLNGYL